MSRSPACLAFCSAPAWKDDCLSVVLIFSLVSKGNSTILPGKVKNNNNNNNNNHNEADS